MLAADINLHLTGPTAYRMPSTARAKIAASLAVAWQ
jgi:hypothetical protein